MNHYEQKSKNSENVPFVYSLPEERCQKLMDEWWELMGKKENLMKMKRMWDLELERSVGVGLLGR